MKNYNLVFISMTGIVVFIDQISKYLARINLSERNINLINNFLSLTLVKNEGALFGLFKNARTLFIVMSFIAILIVLFFITTNKLPLTLILSLGLVSGGIIGNLIDRIFLGYVVDFISIKNFPVFNIADSAIDIGIIIFVIIFIKNGSKI